MSAFGRLVRMSAWTVASLVTVGLLTLTPGAAAQPTSQPDTPPETQPASQPASAPSSQPATASSATTSAAATTGTTTTQGTEKKDRYFAVVDAEVHTVSGPVLRDATVLAKNGKIIAAGRQVRLPDECEVLDARGMRVYPGLVAASAGGLHGPKPAEDTTNVFSLSMNIAVAVGITTAIAGNDACKLTFGAVEDMVVKRDLFVNLRYDNGAPLERAQLRTDLERVREHLRKVRTHEEEKKRNKDAKPPDGAWIKEKFERYRKLLERDAIALVNADRATDVLAAAELASEFGFRLVVRGAYEGWVVAPQLARAEAGAIITARTAVDPDERSNHPTGSTIENARILAAHGVKVAVGPPTASIVTFGVGGRDLTNLNLEAAFAVRGGMSNEDAVRTITIDAARVLGIDERVGSIEVGKDADLIVCDGDLLHFMTMVHYTVVNGRVVYDKAKDTLFGHIRPQGERIVPEFDDQWPRRLQWRD